MAVYFIVQKPLLMSGRVEPLTVVAYACVFLEPLCLDRQLSAVPKFLAHCSCDVIGTVLVTECIDSLGLFFCFFLDEIVPRTQRL